MEYRTHVGRWRSVDNETTGSGTGGGKDQRCPRRQLVLTMGPGGNSDEVSVANPGVGWISLSPRSSDIDFRASRSIASSRGDRGFESVFLQQRVCELSVPEHHAINPCNNLLRQPQCGLSRLAATIRLSRSVAAAGWRSEPTGASGRSPQDRIPCSARRSCSRSCAI
jgi:hypothetical protein